jgi:hypothetical protein
MPDRLPRPTYRWLVVALAFPLACSSPNRGYWQGTFEGGVSGTMQFTVNARGTSAEGRITGATSRGEKFEAEFEGSLNQGFLNARFQGSSQTGVGLPAGFRGELQGDLADGEAAGSWKVDLIQVRTHYEGTWAASQAIQLARGESSLFSRRTGSPPGAG